MYYKDRYKEVYSTRLDRREKRDLAVAVAVAARVRLRLITGPSRDSKSETRRDTRSREISKRVVDGT